MRWPAFTLTLLALAAAALMTAGAAGAAGAQGGVAPKDDSLLPDLEDEVMCLVCGTTLGIAESPEADRERAFIQRLAAEGKDKQQIEDALVAEYGPEVLATPSDSGFDLAAWIVPGLAVIVAAGALVIGLRRWRRDSGSGKGGAPPVAGIDPGDEERLSADLSRYEL